MSTSGKSIAAFGYSYLYYSTFCSLPSTNLSEQSTYLYIEMLAIRGQPSTILSMIGLLVVLCLVTAQYLLLWLWTGGVVKAETVLMWRISSSARMSADRMCLLMILSDTVSPY